MFTPAPLAAGQRTCALPTQKNHEDGQGPPTSRSASPAARGRCALFRHASSGRQLLTQRRFTILHMRIATWNINGLKARRDELVGWLRENRIDVVGLQETKISDHDFCKLSSPNSGRGISRRVPEGSPAPRRRRYPQPTANRSDSGRTCRQKSLGSRLLAVNTAGLSFTTVCVPSASGKGAEGMDRKLAWLDALERQVPQRAGRRRVACRALWGLQRHARAP